MNYAELFDMWLWKNRQGSITFPYIVENSWGGLIFVDCGHLNRLLIGFDVNYTGCLEKLTFPNCIYRKYQTVNLFKTWSVSWKAASW